MVYPIFSELGIIDQKQWNDWGKSESNLRVFGNTSIDGIEVTTGSLGMVSEWPQDWPFLI